MANMFINLFNLIISALGALLSLIIGILPNSPFTTIDNSAVAPFLAGFAWVIPFNFLITVSTAWLACIVVYYAYSIVMRWVKVVS